MKNEEFEEKRYEEDQGDERPQEESFEEEILDGEVIEDPQDESEGDREAQTQVPKEEDPEEESWKNRYTRLQADFTNYKRRREEERKTLVSAGVQKLALDLLPTIDNLERALLAAGDDEEDPHRQGLEMIYKQFQETLKKHHIEEIEALDRPFDPKMHYAVMVEEKEGVPSQTVIEVLQKGYRLDQNVLRPSMVKVSQ